MQNTMKPSGRTIIEVLESMQESFYRANGYHPTEEDAIRLTDEARREIELEKEKRKRKNEAEV